MGDSNMLFTMNLSGLQMDRMFVVVSITSIRGQTVRDSYDRYGYDSRVTQSALSIQSTHSQTFPTLHLNKGRSSQPTELAVWLDEFVGNIH